MKKGGGLASNILSMEKGAKKGAWLKPKVKYQLPEIDRETFLSRWLKRKVKQEVTPETLRENADVIHFL